MRIKVFSFSRRIQRLITLNLRWTTFSVLALSSAATSFTVGKRDDRLYPVEGNNTNGHCATGSATETGWIATGTIPWTPPTATPPPWWSISLPITSPLYILTAYPKPNCTLDPSLDGESVALQTFALDANSTIYLPQIMTWNNFESVSWERIDDGARTPDSCDISIQLLEYGVMHASMTRWPAWGWGRTCRNVQTYGGDISLRC
jgi:hypothetical protein